MATLKTTHLHILFFTDSGVLIEERTPTELDSTHGRLRTAQLAADGTLHLTTSNQADDEILAVTPSP